MSAADLRSGRQVVDQRAGDERGGDAEQREHGAEPGDVGERVAHGDPARRRSPVGRRRDRDGGQLAEVGGHERQHARRQEADDPGGEGDEDRQVGAGHAASGVQDVGQEPAQLGERWSRARVGGRRARRPGSTRSRRAPAPDRSRCPARRGPGAAGRRDARSARRAVSRVARLVAQAAAGA